MFRALVGLALAFLITTAHAQPAPASSRLDDIIKRGTLRVGMTGDYRPFTSLDKTNSKFTGFDVDMAEALGKALGVKVEFVPTAWPQLMKDFEADDFDVAMGGVSITLDRQKKGLFSTPIMREGKTPIARCADQNKYETITDIDKQGTRVIVNPGGTNERFARANVKNAEIKVYNDNVTIFAEASCRRPLRGASGQAVRFLGKGLLAAARCGVEGLRRSVAAHFHGGRQLQADLCGLVRMTRGIRRKLTGRPALIRLGLDLAPDI